MEEIQAKVNVEEDEVVVLVTDVLKIRDALNAAYYKSKTEDWVQAYRNLDVDGSRSRSALTGLLEDALTTAQAIAKLTEDHGQAEDGPEEDQEEN